ncbi:hypothetical protein R5W24_003369 [Gemmata sp. JC717]|nr:hypothetical protein [Gemmata algarum]MDY3554250.1 hypothetical protein [Gemmata algarum]
MLTGTGAGAAPHAKRLDGRTLGVLDSFLVFDAGFAGGVFVG